MFMSNSCGPHMVSDCSRWQFVSYSVTTGARFTDTRDRQAGRQTMDARFREGWTSQHPER